MALHTMKKKTKKRVVILNMGRRFKGPAQPVQDVSSEEDDNQEEDDRSVIGEGKTIRVPKMKTTPTNSILMQMTNTSSLVRDESRNVV